MATVFDDLIKMIERRIDRQERELASSRAQLDAALRSKDEAQKTIVPSVAKK